MEIFSLRMFIRKLSILLVLQLIVVIQGQQTYYKANILDCFKAKRFVCNGAESSCQSYLTFISNPPYNSALNIANLLASKATVITSTNQLNSLNATIPNDTLVVILVNCSCSSQYYQNNSTYKMKSTRDTYFSVANNIYQGISTCQSIMAQNTISNTNLTVGFDLLVPLMCACPTHKRVQSQVFVNLHNQGG
ncbi:hypothetical protein Patl1_06901 [Pistacia atlantica]|uniref:Uncharacterized protein n=1 Tax=Pistacia atlantica TaxID=434234 RepID=A0ACC1ALM1_9ROSI|nr:hypothetical protein Patl1_06901 [Pistacia atlantica]